MTKTRKVKLLEVSVQIVTELCKKAVENKLPDDASVIRTSYNPLTNNFDVIVHSEEFDEVPEGQMIPKVSKTPVVSTDVLK
jgi:hypothetical protein